MIKRIQHTGYNIWGQALQEGIELKRITLFTGPTSLEKSSLLEPLVYITQPDSDVTPFSAFSLAIDVAMKEEELEHVKGTYSDRKFTFDALPKAKNALTNVYYHTPVCSRSIPHVDALLEEQHLPEHKRLLTQAIDHWLARMKLADSFSVQNDTLRVGYGEVDYDVRDVVISVAQGISLILLLHIVPVGSTLILKEPTTYLHPLESAVLANMVVEVALARDLQVLVETTSEHFFRRVQYLIADELLPLADCTAYYVTRPAKLVPLKIDLFGRVENWQDLMFGDATGEIGRQMRRMVDRLQR